MLSMKKSWEWKSKNKSPGPLDWNTGEIFATGIQKVS